MVRKDLIRVCPLCHRSINIDKDTDFFRCLDEQGHWRAYHRACYAMKELKKKVHLPMTELEAYMDACEKEVQEAEAKAPTKRKEQFSVIDARAFFTWVTSAYDVPAVPKTFFARFCAIFNGTSTEALEAVPPAELHAVWQAELPDLRANAAKQARAGKVIVGTSRILYDLKIVLAAIPKQRAEQRRLAALAACVPQTTYKPGQTATDIWDDMRNKQGNDIDIQSILEEI